MVYGIEGIKQKSMQICFFSVIFTKIERYFKLMSATSACRIHIPVIYIFYSLNSYFFFQLANRTGKRNNHFIMHKNFNI